MHCMNDMESRMLLLHTFSYMETVTAVTVITEPHEAHAHTYSVKS